MEKQWFIATHLTGWFDPMLSLRSVFSVALSPDHLSIATGSSDHTIRLWSVQKQRWRLTLRGHRSGVLCATWKEMGGEEG